MPGEAEFYARLQELVWTLTQRMFSNEAITPGVTKTSDLVWWWRQQVNDLGLGTWFQPSISVQRRGVSAAQLGSDPVIQDGDAIFVERAPLVYIYGEVQRPGALRLERGMTLLQALAAGGGLTQRGTEKGIRVHRKNEQGAVQVITPAMDDSVREGDVVFVRESLF